jgi:hypothetical protein
MIQNDQELKVARERVTYLLDLLTRMRVSARPEELPLVASGYRAEVERMQREVVDYLMQPAIKPASKSGEGTDRAPNKTLQPTAAT